MPYSRPDSRGSVTNVLTNLQVGQLRYHGLIPGKGKTLISSPKHPDWLWGHPTSYAVLIVDTFSRGKVVRAHT